MRARAGTDTTNKRVVSDWTTLGGLSGPAFTYDAPDTSGPAGRCARATTCCRQRKAGAGRDAAVHLGSRARRLRLLRGGGERPELHLDRRCRADQDPGLRARGCAPIRTRPRPTTGRSSRSTIQAATRSSRPLRTTARRPSRSARRRPRSWARPPARTRSISPPSAGAEPSRGSDRRRGGPRVPAPGGGRSELRKPDRRRAHDLDRLHELVHLSGGHRALLARAGER